MIENTIKILDYPISRTQRIEQLLFRLKFSDLLKTINSVEIGAGIGETTKVIANNSDKVLVIDPFKKIDDNVHDSYVNPYPLETFLENTKQFTNITLHKESSLHKSTKEKISEFKPINFVFVDGLQFKEIVLKELRMLELFEPNIICVDDINRLSSISEVPLAVEEFLKDSKYKRVEMKTDCQECYLIKK